MSCFHPQRLFFVGSSSEGKRRSKLLPFDYQWIDEHGIAHKGEMPPGERGNNQSWLIPCGHCIGCRSDQSKEWSARLVMEMQYHDSSYFITLTYDDDHVPFVLDEDTGCLNGFQTLDKRDVQLFIKRLRKERPDDRLRYYLAGEYGPSTLRPHYHMIIFGLHLLDWHLVPCGRSETGNQYFTCPEIEKIWSRGFISIEPANEFTCKYVCNYVTKKLGSKPNKVYTDVGMVPPFSLSSRRPGIGYRYFEDHKRHIEEFNKINLSTERGNISVSVPRYFKKKLLEVDKQRFCSDDCYVDECMCRIDIADQQALQGFKRGQDKIEFLSNLNDKDYLEQLSDMEKLQNERQRERNKI